VGEVEIRENQELDRYEALAEGRLVGYAAYRREPGAVVLTHTDVLPAWEGKGVAGRLARAALDDARARGLAVVPRCPYMAAWIRRHPEYEDLVAREG
jgi:predicted GNAT family acetyltransferase